MTKVTEQGLNYSLTAWKEAQKGVNPEMLLQRSAVKYELALGVVAPFAEIKNDSDFIEYSDRWYAYVASANNIQRMQIAFQMAEKQLVQEPATGTWKSKIVAFEASDDYRIQDAQGRRSGLHLGTSGEALALLEKDEVVANLTEDPLYDDKLKNFSKERAIELSNKYLEAWVSLICARSLYILKEAENPRNGKEKVETFLDSLDPLSSQVKARKRLILKELEKLGLFTDKSGFLAQIGSHKAGRIFEVYMRRQANANPDFAQEMILFNN